MKVRLTRALLVGAKAPATGRAYYTDTTEPGLVAQHTSTGKISFQLYKRIGGQAPRITLGQFNAGLADSLKLPEHITAANVSECIMGTPALNVGMARTLARLLKASLVSNSTRPAERKRQLAQEPVVGTLPSREMAKYARPYLAEFEKTPISAINDAAVSRWHSKLGRTKSPHVANRGLQVVRAAINWARKTGLLQKAAINPFAGIKAHPETKRDTFVRRDEAPAFFAALATMPPDWQDYFRLLILTGARRGSMAAMRWDDIDLGGATWRIPSEHSKNKDPLTVPLVPQAVAVLVRRREAWTGSTWVFPSYGRTGHLVSPKKPWRLLLDAMAREHIAKLLTERKVRFDAGDDLAALSELAERHQIDVAGARPRLRMHDCQ